MSALIDLPLLLVAAWEVHNTLQRRLRPAWGLVLVAVLVSAVPFFVGAGDGAVLRFAAAALAASYARREGGWSAEALPDVYPEKGAGRQSTASNVRPVATGLLAGLVAAGHPAYVPLGLAIVATLKARARIVGLVGFAVGCLATLAPAPVGGGWGRALETVVWSPDRTVIYAMLEFALGRNSGVLVYFVPVVLLIALHRFRGWGRLILGGAVAACLLVTLFWPFDWNSGGALPGNGWFLPLYAALLLIPSRPARSWELVAAALVGALFLLPYWWGLLPGVNRYDPRIPSAVHHVLPTETLPRGVAGPRTVAGAMQVWSPDMNVDRGAFVAYGRRWQTLVVSSPTAVEQLWLDCGGQAGVEIDLRGAKGGETLFRADGGVAFAVDLGAGRRQRMAHHDQPAHVYIVRFRLPLAPRAEIRIWTRDKI